MGSAPSLEDPDDQRKLAAKVLAVGAMSPRQRQKSNTHKEDLRDFLNQQKKNKEELWKEIQTQYEKSETKEHASSNPLDDNLDEEVIR